ncbi:MaoC family dehydratase [Acuticoccus kandeliae]|uniref:MaoC family dehydratase n=1 Tax=Acuticoccus kandeliae TaxID=2073160 RepID=UPI00196AB2FE|nr:MaoC family dehydratase [Acuticoccus kandeliae]
MSGPREIRLAELPGLVGTRLGESPWHTITQADIDRFADATGDHAAIHVDPEASRAGPFGTTIAHGFLTLSLVAPLCARAFRLTDAAFLVNYGTNRVRFPAPVPSGARVRLEATLTAAEPRAQGTLLTLDFTMHLENSPRAAVVGETLLLVVAEGHDG